MLVIQNRSAFADAVSGREPIPAPPRTTLAVVSAPGSGRTEARNEAPRRQNDAPAKGPVREIPQADTSAAPAAAPEAPSPASPRIIRLKMRVTAYCPCSRCCGKFADGKTASGKPIWTNGARFVAAPKWIPFGAKIRVPGYHEAVAVPVLDRGGQIYGHRLDVFFLSHHVAKEWAVQYLDVEIEMPR
jgi:3D (Asp-Asp-Asp) domain-containing protein